MDIVRAWKDPSYRDGLAGPDAAAPSPVGRVELDDVNLDGRQGGSWTVPITITIELSIQFCSPAGTLCGSCEFGTRGCC